MKKLKIGGYEFDLNNNVYKILQNYLYNLEKLVKKYNIDKDSYYDLLSLLSEKLLNLHYEKGNIDQHDVVHIISEIGEPEEIFEIDDFSNQAFETKKLHEVHEKTIFEKYGKYIAFIIFLFLCFIIAGIDRRNVLILFFLFIFFILFFILFYNSKYNNSDELETDKGLNKSNKFYFIKSIKNLIFKYISLFVSIFKFCFSKFYLIIIFFLSVFFFILSFFIIFVLGFYFSNLESFEVFTIAFPIGFMCLLLSFFLFGIILFFYVFRKKGFGSLLPIYASGLFLIGVFCGSYFIFTMLNKYNYRETFEKTYAIDIGTGGYLNENGTGTYFRYLNFDEFNKNNGSHILGFFLLRQYFGDFTYYKTDLKISPDNKIHIFAKGYIYAPKENMQDIISSMNPLVGKKEGYKILKIFFKDNLFYNKKVPFNFIKFNVLEVQIPKNLAISVHSFNYNNVSLGKYEKYRPYIRTFRARYIYFDEKAQKFTYYFDDEYIEKIKKLNLKIDLIKNLSDLSFIKHNEYYKREYYNIDSSEYSDWKIDFDDNIKISSGFIDFNYKDQSLDINAIVNYSNSGTNYEFTGFKIKNIEINNDIFNEEYYTTGSLGIIYKIKK